MMTMANLMQAHNQWRERPADERFWTIQEMADACRTWKEQATSRPLDFNTIRAMYDSDNMCIVSESGNRAVLTNWSFGQMCQRVNAPAAYLRQLPGELAAQCLNQGLKERRESGTADNGKILIHRNGSIVCRAFNGPGYTRIWNSDICDKLTTLPEGWRPPPALGCDWQTHHGELPTRKATEDDCLRTSLVRPGDTISPSGLYASDHDMFAFLVNDDVRVDDGTDGGLGRGFFVSNSEVGGGSFKVTAFLYRYVCGNHIVWDASVLGEIRIIHRGQAARGWDTTLRRELAKYSQASTEKEVERIQTAKASLIGSSADEVIDRIYQRKSLQLSKTLVTEAYAEAVEESDARPDVDPRSIWGMVQGLTHLSQRDKWADKRTEIDRAAGKLLVVSL